ncbi:hypothetical protein ACOSP7_023044 [Xanthoceras sorbifolium]
MQAELVGSNNHKYGTWIRASSPPKERFSNVNKFSSNLEGSVNDGIQLQGRSDRNSGGNGGDKSCGLNDTTISHVSAKGNEKIGADTVQDSSVEKIDKDADFPPGFQRLKIAENGGIASRPDITITPNIMLAFSEICGSDSRSVSTN